MLARDLMRGERAVMGAVVRGSARSRRVGRFQEREGADESIPLDTRTTHTPLKVTTQQGFQHERANNNLLLRILWNAMKAEPASLSPVPSERWR